MRTGNAVPYPGPTGGVPPVAKPVVASATSGAAIFQPVLSVAAASFLRSTRASPATMTTASAPSAACQTSDLMICTGLTPIAAAANGTVGIGTPGITNGYETPAAARNVVSASGGVMSDSSIIHVKSH